MPETNHFDRLSRRVASKFLSTVVVVDDQAVLARSSATEQPRRLHSPGRQAGETKTSSQPSTSGLDAAHRLDAKRLIDRFAERGVLCAVLRPQEQELDSLDRVLSRLAAVSDVVILDWVLHEFKQGQKAIEIIKELLKSSGPDRGRARLIIVYSGENDLDQIAQNVRVALKLPEDNNLDDPYTIERGAARICIYAKEQSRVSVGNRARRIDIDKLPEVVINEFANMTRGLVSNVALLSLAALRANTHQILKRFHNEVDAPFVTHRTLLAPEEASDHLVPLIVSEIQAVLEDTQVSAIANHKGVAQWLAYQFRRGLKPPDGVPEKEFRQGLAFLLEHGTGNTALNELFSSHERFAKVCLKSKNKAVSSVRDHLTGLVTVERDRAEVSDNELAALMSVRSRYASPAPRLTLGSIVLETRRRRSEYLLCVQPRCDSVRLYCERAFPFLPMQRVDDDKECDLIIAEKEGMVRLRLQDRPFEVRMIRFGPTKPADGQVLARRAKSGRFFKAASRTQTTYRWIGDLKPEHAQRVANDHAYKLSRVGLTESEWLRKWMP